MSSTERQAVTDLYSVLMTTDQTELAAFAQERSQAYCLLSRLFLNAPEARHLLQLHADLAFVEESGPLGELRQAVASSLNSPDVATGDFTRRLVVAGKASGEDLPFESHVREGRIPGTVTKAVIECMDDAGITDIVPEAPSPDHIGAELKFMAMLCRNESQAWSQGKQSEAKQVIAIQRHFLTLHLAAWAPDYCEALEARAEHGYVKAIARLARRCLLAEVAAVEAMFIRFNKPQWQARCRKTDRA